MSTVAEVSGFEHCPPSESELEVSVFGSGFGECILVHLPGTGWLIVDSCMGSDGRPTSIAYLEEMGLDPSECVRTVLATHWHLDHVKGIAETVRYCSNAEPVISGGLHARELFAFAGAVEFLGDTAPQAIGELRALAEIVIQEGAGRVLTTGQARMQLLTGTHAGLLQEAKILSPSPVSVQAALADLSATALHSGPISKYPRPDHNAAAVVVQIRSGAVGVLLASDLERHSDRRRGWHAVADQFGHECKRSLIKIAHHGSENGNVDRIWDELMDDSPVGALTHFHNGSVHLPTAAILSAICARCDAIYSPSGEAYSESVISVEELAIRVSSGVGVGTRKPGHVRFRTVPGVETSWRVETFGHASSVVGSSNVVEAAAVSVRAQ